MVSHTVLSSQSLQILENDTNKVNIKQLIDSFIHGDFLSPLDKEVLDMRPNDCSLVSKFSQVESFDIEGRKISLTTLVVPHPLREFHKRSIEHIDNPLLLRKAHDQLSKIDKLPILVFIHGLGGQMSQFEPILQEFRNCADIFALDLPGFGNSKRASRNNQSKNVNFSSLSQYSKEDLELIENTLDSIQFKDFSTDNIVNIIYGILLQKFPNRRFIILSHSMGTHISIKLTNKLPTGSVESLIMMTPPRLSDSDQQLAFSRLPFGTRLFFKGCYYLPQLFDIYRMMDRRGGLHSKSVNSFIYPSTATVFQRLTQYRWNLDTDSSIFINYLMNFKPATANELLMAASKLNNTSEDNKMNPRILIIGADSDKVTPVSICEQFSNILSESNIPFKFDTIENANHSLFLDKPELVSGTIYQFVENLQLNISCTWVLQVKALISGDKWGLKNKAKWDKVVTISTPLINLKLNKHSPLLGMKTLKQTDLIHNPKKFELNHTEIFAIVDIGSDTPAYDPIDFKRIKYVKFKTESKVVPDNVTIIKFIDIIDGLLNKCENKDQYIVVHCHYGQNRTGFLICCYLIEKLGWSPSEAIDAWERAKNPGIKHVHFKNALYLRYRT
ncbi:triacylglycerol lipase [Martiniozyma asiatica (nom. inval.)]|nr:triacylglycerol lipase [Martiniozyma asiatica]